MQDFVHLHVHSQYSILDGQASISGLISKAEKCHMKGIALTDHGNMFGIKEFWNAVKKTNGKRADNLKIYSRIVEAVNALGAEENQIEAAKEYIASQISSLDPESDKKKIKSEKEIVSAISKLADDKVPYSKILSEFEYLSSCPQFKCIIGCEVYVARRGAHLQESKIDAGGWHLILLAKNQKGYKNLIKIVSKANTEGYYYRPRTDHSVLEQYHEGIICLSACLGGEIPRLIAEGRLEEAEQSVLWHKSIFGEDYYLELQLHKATAERANYETAVKQEEVNKVLVEIAHKHNIPLVCTNDVHFVNEDDAEAHDRLICLSTGKLYEDTSRLLYTKQEWLKSQEEMAQLFPDIPEAMENSVKICDKVESYSINHDPIMPKFPIPEEFGTEEGYREKFTEKDLFDEFTQDENGNVVLSKEDADAKIAKLGGYDALYRIKLEADYLKHLTMIGARRLYGDPLSEEMQKRIIFELHIMKTMGFPGYFLIVQDFINAARKELGVWVGPGRGSAAGSAVAYCLGITKLDPVKYDLLFERFLNPDRISLPDIDIDFDDDGRKKVLTWVTEKYGAANVAHIITFQTMATKNSIKDVARVLDLPLQDANRLCKLVPAHLPDNAKINLKNCVKLVPELNEASKSENRVLSDTIKYALQLEGNVRGTGVHACGTIICRDDITDWVPVHVTEDKKTKEKLLVTQYEGSIIEDTGLIKMDFLGLANLSIMKEAVSIIKELHGIDVDVDTIPIDDELTYKLYQAGNTIGTFQFESAGMQNYLRQLQPTVFADLIAMNALYRPGPMDYIPDFIDRKLGRKPIEYDIPIMETYLKDTYGITVYQEQVMLLSRLLAGFTRGEADTLRKAMGKKLKDKLDSLYPKFIAGGKNNGHNPEILEKIWKDWEKFASYAFNKSHAACYSWVAYQTAYMKAHYPAEYMSSLLSANLADITTLTDYMTECRRMGIEILQPDINESYMRFYPNKDGNIRFGLSAIKGVGEGAVDAILKERKANGRFTDIYNFFERVNSTQVNRKCLENMIKAGVFDSIIDFHRSQFFVPVARDKNFLDALSEYSNKFNEDTGNNLFGDLFNDAMLPKPAVPNGESWGQLETLEYEKEVTGLFISSHPLDDYKAIISKQVNTKVSEFEDLQEVSKKKEFVCCGIVAKVEKKMTKAGREFANVTLEDYDGTYQFAFFSREYEAYKSYLEEKRFLILRGVVALPKFEGARDLRINFTSINNIQDEIDRVKSVSLIIPTFALTNEMVSELVKFVKDNKGGIPLKITLQDISEKVSLDLFSKSKKISINNNLLKFIETHGLQYNLKLE